MFTDNPSLQQLAAVWTGGAAFLQAEDHQHAQGLLGCRAGGRARGVGDPPERL